MKTNILVIALASTIAFTGCANMSETQKGTAQGAGIGAVGGAVIGAIAGGKKGALIGAAVGGGAGAIAGNVWSKRMQEQKAQMEQATAGTGVAVTQTADNRLKLDIPSDVSFDVGRADVKANFKSVLDTFATSLTKNPSTNVTVIGHTDSTGSDAVNNPLSLNRAASVRSYLVNHGVATSRIAIDGKGSHEPIAPNDTAANKAKNRRVEIYVAEPAPVANNAQ
ncbi:MAG: OmpA family protein [Methylophilus sp.]|jgi:outer membrane protein OmpA-like peptidoglycan-associated protein